MILVDTSIWIDHFRKPDLRLEHFLDEGKVCIHGFIIGEVALGHLKPRKQVLGSMGKLPHAVTARNAEVLALIETENLQGSGIGFVDAHLLASARLTPGVSIWTRDKTLQLAVQKIGVELRES